jgi:hypothetical protein
MEEEADNSSQESSGSEPARKRLSPIAELTRTVRNFFAELLDIQYQFTYDELNHELYNHNLDWKFRAQIDKFFKGLTEMEFGGREVTEEEVGAAAREAKSIIKRLSGYVQERPKSRSADWGKKGVFSKLKRITGLDIGASRKRGDLQTQEEAEAEKEKPVDRMPEGLQEEAEQPDEKETQQPKEQAHYHEPEQEAPEPPPPPPPKADHKDHARGGSAEGRALGRLGRLSKRISRARPVIVSRSPRRPKELFIKPRKPLDSTKPTKPIKHGMTAGESGPHAAPTVEGILSNIAAFAGNRIRLVGTLKFVNRIIEKTDFWYMFEDTTGKIVAVSKNTDKYEGRGTLRGVVKKTLTGEAFIEIESFN